jgi:hypothetical protein
MKSIGDICEEITQEVIRAESKHPIWPDDYIHQAAIVCEESGELIRAALNDYYDGPTPNSREEIRKEAIQTAAMCIRLLKNL